MNQDLNNNFNSPQSNYDSNFNSTMQEQNTVVDNNLNTQSTDFINNNDVKKENHSKKYLIIGFIIILVLFGVVIGVKLLNGNSNIDKSDSNNSFGVVDGNNNNIVSNQDDLIPEGVDFKNINKDAIPYTDESYFKYRNIDDNTCEIISNESEDRIIKVPEEISGRKVVGIAKYAFINNKITEYIILPDAVEYIDDNAFVNDEALRYIDFGKNLKKVGYGTFNNVNLETVDFPEGMESMNSPFGFVDNLKDVYIPASVTNITKIASTKMTPNIVIVTPAGSKAEEIAKRDGLPVRNK